MQKGTKKAIVLNNGGEKSLLRSERELEMKATEPYENERVGT